MQSELKCYKKLPVSVHIFDTSKAADTNGRHMLAIRLFNQRRRHRKLFIAFQFTVSNFLD